MEKVLMAGTVEESFAQRYGDLQEKYKAWRHEMEETSVNAWYMTDCAFKSVRESFAKYCGLEEIPFEVMLWCESNYDNERGMAAS